MDIEETLREYLPPCEQTFGIGHGRKTDLLTLTDAFDKSASFNAKIQDDTSAKDFKPAGELIKKYTSRGRNFEIWCGELTDPAVQRLIERIQVLILFFIDGGTMLALDDQEWSISRWRVFFMYIFHTLIYRQLTEVSATATRNSQIHQLQPPHPIPLSATRPHTDS